MIFYFWHFSIRLFRIISIPLKVSYFHLPDHVILMECQALDFRCQYNVHNENSNRYVAFYPNVPQLKEFLTLSVKDRYQLICFICIKDFNAETITSLKLNLFSSLFSAVSIMKGKRPVLIYFCYQIDKWGTEHKYLLCRFLGVSFLQLLINYRIYDYDTYDMLTLSQ